MFFTTLVWFCSVPVIFLGVLSPAGSETLVIYEHVGRQGESLQLTVEGCTPIPTIHGWNDRVSSVDNKNRCITLHDNGDCTGRFIDILPGDSNQFDLYTAGFDDLASSASPCAKGYRGAFIEEGTYYIESAEDESAITTEAQAPGSAVSRAILEDAVDVEQQRWNITKHHEAQRLNAYFIIAHRHTSNSITVDYRTGGAPKNIWHFLPREGGKYMIFRHTPRGSNICLVNRGFGNPVAESYCENNSRRQMWRLRKVDDAL